MLQSIKELKVRSKKVDEKSKGSPRYTTEPSYENEEEKRRPKSSSSSVFTRLRFGNRQISSHSPPPKTTASVYSKPNKIIDEDFEISLDKKAISSSYSILNSYEYKNTSSIAETVKLRRSLNQAPPHKENTPDTSRRVKGGLLYTSTIVDKLELIDKEVLDKSLENRFECVDHYFSDAKSPESGFKRSDCCDESANASYDAIYPSDAGDIPQFICDFDGINSNEEALSNSLFNDFSGGLNLLEEERCTIPAEINPLESYEEGDCIEVCAAAMAASQWELRNPSQPLTAQLRSSASAGDELLQPKSVDELCSDSGDSSMSWSSSATSSRPGRPAMGKNKSRREIVSTAVKLSAEYLPPVTKPYVLGVEPYLAEGAATLEIIISIVMIFLELSYELCMFLWDLMRPLHSELVVLLPSFTGLIVCFFGGSFMTIISAVEAYRLCGYETTLRGLSQIYEDLQRVYKSYNEQKAELEKARRQEESDIQKQSVNRELKVDSVDQLDRKPAAFNASSFSFSGSSDAPISDRIEPVASCEPDLDGAAAVDSSSSSSSSTALCKSPERFHMADPSKTSHEQHVDMAVIFLRTVDPNKFIDALVGVNLGFIAVLATVKLSFAKTITLGQSISNIVMEPANEFVLPLIEVSLPEEYKKWARPVLKYSIRSAALSIAWSLRRVLSSYHSAITGGLMFSRNTLSYFKVIPSDAFSSSSDSIKGDGFLHRCLVGLLAYAVAALGIYFQLSLGFHLPFPLNIVLFPFTAVEYLLMWMVNHSTHVLI